MFLHLVYPDSKFPSHIRALFETVAPGRHLYVFIRVGEDLPPPCEGFHVVQAPAELQRLLADHPPIEGVIVNGMMELVEPYLDMLPSAAPMAWFIWGHEVYRHAELRGFRLRDPLTQRHEVRTLGRAFKARWRRSYWTLQGRFRKLHRVLRRVDIFVSQLQSEYELLVRLGFVERRQEWHRSAVVLLSSLVDLNAPLATALGDDIQVGNSATPTNNHVDVFARLREIGLGERNVVVPLSYGDLEYRPYVLAEGTRLLGPRFVPIVDFMPVAAYSALLQRCGTSIFNIKRQQAIGNVLAALWQGRRVYLGESTLLDEYRRWGLPVYSYESELRLDRGPLTVDELAAARALITAKLGDDAVLNATGDLLRKLEARSGEVVFR